MVSRNQLSEDTDVRTIQEFLNNIINMLSDLGPIYEKMQVICTKMWKVQENQKKIAELKNTKSEMKKSCDDHSSRIYITEKGSVNLSTGKMNQLSKKREKNF